jgi:hypothetical protein
MADANTVISEANSKIIGAFSGTGTSIVNVVGWIFFILLLIGGGFWFYIYSKDRKVFTKRITAFDRVGIYWEPVFRDVAKTVKIGKGGFEILFLKKAKTWKLAYGGRVGRNDYYFFIMPDGYWYNGMMCADVNKMDDKGGLVPIVTTNPLMRAQYTALEKQVDSLHGEKTNFWDKYGSWVLGVAFVLIAGVMLWLNYKEYAHAMDTLGSVVGNLDQILGKLSNLAGNIQGTSSGGSGLVPV